MADINHIISLGLGSPAAIKFFITLGLGIGIVSPTPACRTFTVSAEVREYDILAETRTYTVPCP